MLKAKYTGCMVGSALGDAIGELAFMYSKMVGLNEVIDTADSPLVYTDDTAMAIGLAESLLEKDGLDQEHLGSVFQQNHAREPWRGYASGPPTIFSMVQSSGISYVEAAKRLFGGSGSFGNGAAMRVAPLGLVYHDSPDLYATACASAEVTHAHPLAGDGAAVQALAVAEAVKSHSREPFSRDLFAEKLQGFARTTEMQNKLRLVRELLRNGSSDHDAIHILGKSVAVHESLPFALFSFLKYPHSYESCLYCAILNGGDRDTLGAMAGAVSGAYLGVEAIPERWRTKLENGGRIQDLAEALLGCRRS
jgi:poly(ADP-ribose) glycohydrolase ARH3